MTELAGEIGLSQRQ